MEMMVYFINIAIFTIKIHGKFYILTTIMLLLCVINDYCAFFLYLNLRATFLCFAYSTNEVYARLYE